MPVVTRSRSKRGKKPEAEGSVQETVSKQEEKKTPRRSARIAAARARRSESREPTEEQVSQPGSKPRFSGITLGSDTLDSPMQFLVPRHEAESPYDIRQHIRQFTESPVTLKHKSNNKTTKTSNTRKKSNKNSKKNKSNKSSKNSNNSKNNNSINYESSENDSNDSEIENDSNDKNDSNTNNINRFSSEPSRIPTFNQNSQSWSFEPETEVPQLTRNLMIFIISVIVSVLAVVYKDDLSIIYHQYMPESISGAFSTLSDTVMGIFTYVYNLVTNIFTSSDSAASSDDSSINTTNDAKPLSDDA